MPRRRPPSRATGRSSGPLLFTLVLFLRPQDIFPPLEVLHLAEMSAIAGLAALDCRPPWPRRAAHPRHARAGRGRRASALVILLTAPFSIWMGGAIRVFNDLYVKVILVYLLALTSLIDAANGSSG